MTWARFVWSCFQWFFLLQTCSSSWLPLIAGFLLLMWLVEKVNVKLRSNNYPRRILELVWARPRWQVRAKRVCLEVKKGHKSSKDQRSVLGIWGTHKAKHDPATPRCSQCAWSVSYPGHCQWNRIFGQGSTVMILLYLNEHHLIENLSSVDNRNLSWHVWQPTPLLFVFYSEGTSQNIN